MKNEWDLLSDIQRRLAAGEAVLEFKLVSGRWPLPGVPPQDEPARLAALDAPDQYELGTDFFTVLMEFKTRLPVSHTIDYLGGKFAIGPGLKPWGPFAPNGGTIFQLDLSNLAEAKKLEDLFPQSPPPPPDDEEDEDDAWRQ